VPLVGPGAGDLGRPVMEAEFGYASCDLSHAYNPRVKRDFRN